MFFIDKENDKKVTLAEISSEKLWCLNPYFLIFSRPVKRQNQANIRYEILRIIVWSVNHLSWFENLRLNPNCFPGPLASPYPYIYPPNGEVK